MTASLETAPHKGSMLRWSRRTVRLLAALGVLLLLFGLVAGFAMTRTWVSAQQFPQFSDPSARLPLVDTQASAVEVATEVAVATVEGLSTGLFRLHDAAALRDAVFPPLVTTPQVALLHLLPSDARFRHRLGLGIERTLWRVGAALDEALIRHTAAAAHDDIGRTLQGLWWTYGAFMVGAVMLVIMLIVIQRRSYATMEAMEQGRQELQRARNQLSDAVNAIGDGFLLLDQDMAIVTVNQRFRQIYGPMADKLRQGAPVEDLLRAAFERGHYAVTGAAAPALERALEHLRHPLAPYEIQLADGRWLRIHSRTTADGGTVSLHTDITDAKRSEMRLRQRVAGIDAALDGIALADDMGRFLYANPSLAHMHGLRSTVLLVGQPWSLLFSAEMRDRFEAEALPDLLDQQRWSGELRGARRDGTDFPMELSLSRLADGTTLWVVRDVTERRAVEEERTQLQRQFYQSQKMEAMGRLAGGIAHDFNNILASMLGYAALLEEDLAPDSQPRFFAQRIVAGAERAKALVKQILAFSRSQDTERKQTDMGVLVQETADMLASTLPRQVTVDLVLPERLPPIKADPTQIVQVIMNLCVNASDAMGSEGGTLKIEVHDTDIDGGCADGLAQMNSLGDRSQPLRIRTDRDTGATELWLGILAPPGGYMCLSVTDSGTGIPADVVERMFEPFFTTKEVGKGTGLGLAAVHGIVTRHQGALHLSTHPGKGTRFRIYLPLWAEPDLPKIPVIPALATA